MVDWFLMIFGRTELKIILSGAVFRVEFGGDIHFCIAPPKSMFLEISIDFFEVSRNFLFFEFSVKLIFFATAKPKTLPQTRRPPVATAVAICHFNFARACNEHIVS